MFTFQYHKGIINSESKYFGMNLLNSFCTLWKVLLTNVKDTVTDRYKCHVSTGCTTWTIGYLLYSWTSNRYWETLITWFKMMYLAVLCSFIYVLVTQKSTVFPNITEITTFFSGSKYISMNDIHLRTKEENFASSNSGHLWKKYYILTKCRGVYIMFIFTYMFLYAWPLTCKW